MTAVKFVTLWCDEDGCDEHVNTTEHHTEAARTVAWKRFAWVRRDGKDLCPRHQR